MGRSFRLTVVAVAALALVGAACGNDDDGAAVRNPRCATGASASRSASGSASASGTGCASGSGSASGSQAVISGPGAGDPRLATAVTRYRTYLEEQVEATLALTKTFTDAVRAGDVDAAEAAYAPSRAGWKAIEPVAGQLGEVDGAVDGPAGAFAGVDDPAFTGWHRIEHLLWVQHDPAAAVPFADKLDVDLQTLQQQVPTLEISPLTMARGSARLVKELAEVVASRGADQDSGTELSDLAANLAGVRKIVELLTPVLLRKAPRRLAGIEAALDAVDATLARYRTAAGGYQPYPAVSPSDRSRLAADLAALSTQLARVPEAIGLI